MVRAVFLDQFANAVGNLRLPCILVVTAILRIALIDIGKDFVRFINHHEIEWIRSPKKRTTRDAFRKLTVNQKNSITTKFVRMCCCFPRIDTKEIVEFCFPLPQQRFRYYQKNAALPLGQQLRNNKSSLNRFSEANFIG